MQPDRLALSLRADGDGPRDITVRSYAMRAATANAEARTVDAILATENEVLAVDLRSYTLIREILVISGMRNLPNQVPLLDTHDRSSVAKLFGSTRSLRVEGSELIGTRHFSSVAKDVFTKVQEGHLTDGSLGYRPLRFTELEPGESTTINGRSFSNTGADRLRITYEWMPVEDSVAAIGQDVACKVRSDPSPPINPTTAARADATKESPMTPEQLIALYGEAHRALILDLHAKKKTDAEIAQAVMAAVSEASARAARGTPPPATQTGTTGDEAIRAQTMAAERTRVTAIRAAAGTDMPVELVNRAIDENWDLARANTEFLAEARRARQTPVSAGGQPTGAAHDPTEILVSTEDKFQRSLEVALAHRAFPAGHRALATFSQAQIDEARPLMGCRLQDIARLALRAHRQVAPIDHAALFARAISTYSFPVALGNTLNRMLQGSYEASPSTLLRWASVGSVKDFREHKNIKLGKFARPVKVGKGDPMEHGTVQEEAEGFSVSTYATRFVISRQDFINDDMGLFDRIAVELGESMRMNIDDVGYDLLVSASGVGPTLDADSKALFATDHVDFDGKNAAQANYTTSATYVLSAVGLTELKRMLRVLKAGGRPLNLVPKYLLVPAALEQKALELVTSSNIIIGGTTDVRGERNVHANTLEVIVEPRLDAGTNGATAWYLVCDPARAKSLQVSFLNGNRLPVIERETNVSPLSLGWSAYHDVGVDAIDYRGIVRARGA